MAPPPHPDAPTQPRRTLLLAPAPRSQPHAYLVWPCVTPLAHGAPFRRTLEFLMRHLVHMASFSAQTNMHARNLAIVWAPNLLRWALCGDGSGRAVAVWMHWRGQGGLTEPGEKRAGTGSP